MIFPLGLSYLIEMANFRGVRRPCKQKKVLELVYLVFEDVGWTLEFFLLSKWSSVVGFSEATVRGKRIRKPHNGADLRAVSLLLLLQGLHKYSATKMDWYWSFPNLHKSILINRMCLCGRFASICFLNVGTCYFLSHIEPGIPHSVIWL